MFPGEDDKRAELMEVLGEICRTDEDVMWVAKRASTLLSDWSRCGVQGLWQIWFSKHPPRNREERQLDKLVGSTVAFPEGIPAENPVKEQLALPPLKRPDIAGLTASPELQELVVDMAAEHSKRPGLTPTSTRPAQVITTEEVEEARKLELERRKSAGGRS